MKLDISEKFKLVWDFIKYLMHRYDHDGCRNSAAALTYTSLFAVVPLITMMYAMFSVVPAFQGLGDQVQELIFNNFIPESGTEIQQYLVKFSSQARTLSAAGVIILAVTAYMMLANIEYTFNKIWGTAGGRKGLSSFLLYWGVLSLGPLLIGLGLMMQTYLVSFRLMVDELDALGLLAFVFGYLPMFMTWLAFSLLFAAVPNCRVNIRYAAAGGLVTTILFELAKWVFGFAVSHTSFTSIYGAFAFFPIFLIWIYLSWMIVLGGAEFVRSLETFGTVWKGNRYPDLVVILIILWECWERQKSGLALSERDMLKSDVKEDHWRAIRDLLLKRKYLAQTTQGRYVLMRDLSQVTLWDLGRITSREIAELPNAGAMVTLQHYPWFPALRELLEKSNADVKEIFSPKVNELFQEQNNAEAGEQ